MSNVDLIAALEYRLINAWPAFEVELVEGWLLRFAEGYSKRANSATPIVPGATLEPDLVRFIEGAFEKRGLSPCFRLTGLEDVSAGEVLARGGYEEFDPSLCLIARLDCDLPEADPTVRISAGPKATWIKDAAASYGGDKGNAEILGRIVRLIRQDAAFATLQLDEQDAAWGLAVRERGYAGLYDIVVAPDLRGLGLGRKLVCSLMGWAREGGASHAYLQVRETNEVALSLYRALGFELAYRYTHRVPPQA